MSLTIEQFKTIKEEAEPIISSLLRKEAFLLAQKLKPQISALHISDPKLYEEAQKIIAQLEWTSCAATTDEYDFFRLFKEHLLEGIEMEDRYLWPDGLLDIVTEKLATQFGVGLQETMQGILQALRENNQLIGANLISVKGEARAVRPSIRHWLIDFLRNVNSGSPSEVDETNYLFNNPNAKALSEEDRKILGKVLDFYNSFTYVARQLAFEENQRRIIPPPEPAEAAPPQNLGSRFSGAPANQQTYNQPSQQEPQPTPSIPQPNYPPPTYPPSPGAAPPSNIPIQPPPRHLTSSSPYREEIEESDLAGPQAPPKPMPPAPKIEGNTINLREFGEQKQQ